MSDWVEDLKELVEKQLETQRERIYELEKELKVYKRAIEWGWTVPTLVAADTYPAALPVPRLQMELVKQDEGCWAWNYDLIRETYADGIERRPLGRTTTTCHERPTYEPRRESFHIRHDAAQLKLPAFRCLDGTTWERLSSLERFKTATRDDPDIYVVETLDEK